MSLVLNILKIMGKDPKPSPGSWKYLNDLYDRPDSDYSMTPEIIAAKTLASLMNRDGVSSPRRKNDIVAALRKVADILEYKDEIK